MRVAQALTDLRSLMTCALGSGWVSGTRGGGTSSSEGRFLSAAVSFACLSAIRAAAERRSYFSKLTQGGVFPETRLAEGGAALVEGLKGNPTLESLRYRPYRALTNSRVFAFVSALTDTPQHHASLTPPSRVLAVCITTASVPKEELLSPRA